MGQMFLIIVDAHSKWLDAHIMWSITSTKTIELLQSVFATHGLPQKVVTDNCTSFTSQEFEEFMKANGIKHITSSPCHPSTNGLAERSVQTLKLGIKCTKGSGEIVEVLILLSHYSACDNWNSTMRATHETFKVSFWSSHDNSHPLSSLEVTAKVYAKNLTTNNPKLIAGTVTKVTGLLSYVIQLEDSRFVRWHVDHVKKRNVFVVDFGVSTDPWPTPDSQDITTETQVGSYLDDTADLNADQENEPEHTDSSTDKPESLTQPCRSAQVQKPPNYFSKWEY